MTSREARAIVKAFYKINHPSDSNRELFVEAMEYLILKERDPEDMMELGGYYYALGEFDLARRYYEMASKYKIDAADECLGYIWYYGRTGKVDYKKAYEYFSRSMARGNPVSTYKLADMYKNGYYVEKDEFRYIALVMEAADKVSTSKSLNDPVPEVMLRLGGIYASQDLLLAAADSYIYGKRFLAQRMKYTEFFGNFEIMKDLVKGYQDVEGIDEENFDFYDLYELLKEERKITFRFKGDLMTVESFKDPSVKSGMKIRFNDKEFDSINDFFKKAYAGVQRVTVVYGEFEEFEIV